MCWKHPVLLRSVHTAALLLLLGALAAGCSQVKRSTKPARCGKARVEQTRRWFAERCAVDAKALCDRFTPLYQTPLVEADLPAAHRLPDAAQAVIHGQNLYLDGQLLKPWTEPPPVPTPTTDASGAGQLIPVPRML